MSHVMPWTQVGLYVQDLQAVDSTLRPSDEVTGEEREAQFVSLQQAWQSSTDPVHQHFAKMMSSFEPGLFVGGEAADCPADNLDLERWFKRSQRPRASDPWPSPRGRTDRAARSNADVGA